MFLLNMNILLSFLLFVIFPKTIGQSRKNKACEMLIVVDDTLYQSYGSDDDRIINLVDEHIDELNRIFHGTVFIDRYSQLYFHAKNIEIWSDFCEECNQTQTVFLNEVKHFDLTTKLYCSNIVQQVRHLRLLSRSPLHSPRLPARDPGSGLEEHSLSGQVRGAITSRHIASEVPL